jgi:transcriptional regulator with XRE-family HTH domain
MMVNTISFKERLEQILAHYQLSASAFADAIGVQRSSISHLLSGRNKPSLDFVLKVVREFPEVNLYWLLNGKGNFPDTHRQRQAGQPIPPGTAPEIEAEKAEAEVDSIVVFYKDGSFRKFLPSDRKKQDI